MKEDGFFFTEVNPNVVGVQYAVKGAIPTKALEIIADLKANPDKYPFKDVTFCSIGNPQGLGQTPLTFVRETLACALCPSLFDSKDISEDAKKRAKWYLDNILSAGVYTHSTGIPAVRESVAKFIEKNDKVVRPSIDDIFITDGSSSATQQFLSMVIFDKNDGVMMSIPQYPLYSATITLNGGKVVPYFLEQETQWQLSPQELQRSYNEAIGQGIKVKAICSISPGNPTGSILSEQTMTTIIKFAVEKKIIVMIDEVYRGNFQTEGQHYLSYRAVLGRMDEYHQKNCEIASVHSVSKGVLGECGLRGGYLYLHNIHPNVKLQLTKLKSLSLCPNNIGQFAVQLMCNPPLQDVEESTKQKYLAETREKYLWFAKRSKIVRDYLNSMKNIVCQGVAYEGATFDFFPLIKFSNHAIKVAQGKPDFMYCMEALTNAGIVLVPGSGFKQKEGSFHVRVTMLMQTEQKLMEILGALKNFNDKFHEKYADE